MTWPAARRSRGTRRLAGTIGAGLLAVLLLRLFVADHGQCDRRCAALFGSAATGSRSWVHPSTCACTANGRTEWVKRSNPATGPQPPGAAVCGADGKTYDSAEEARSHTTPLHAGPCGACSNPADIEVYRRTASTLTGVAERCAFVNTIFGESAGRRCLRAESGLTPSCTDCWVSNMSCTAAHCLGACLAARIRGDPRNLPDGRLNPCLACDEAYCGGPFIRCAGANRRRAGIVSDIERGADVWRGGRP